MFFPQQPKVSMSDVKQKSGILESRPRKMVYIKILVSAGVAHDQLKATWILSQNADAKVQSLNMWYMIHQPSYIVEVVVGR